MSVLVGAVSALDPIAAIEAIVCRDVGRGIGPLLAATRGNLQRAAQSLGSVPKPKVGIITGFYVPTATVPAPETDGLIGAAHLAAGLTAGGVEVRLATDEPCADAMRVALQTAGGEAAALDVVPLGHAMTPAISALTRHWNKLGLTHVLAIERCGKAQDGKPYNMAGVDVSPWTAPLDDLYLAGQWTRLAIGDGGNEVGMGALPAELVAREVPNGGLIACRTTCDILVAVGVSNWGAYGLLAALACLWPDRAELLTHSLTPARDLAILKRTVEHGGAIDGVLRRRVVAVDGHPPAVHADVLRAIRAAIGLR